MQCIFCLTTVDAGIGLSNGGQVHSSCLEGWVEKYYDVQSQLGMVLAEYENHLAYTKDDRSLIKAILEIFSIKDDRADYEAARLRLEDKLDVAKKNHEQLLKIVTPVFDYIIGYPADWSVRKEKIKIRDHSCQECGSIDALHVHHKTPLSRGGSNRLENLVLLCERCHSRTHGERVFPYADTERELSFKKKVDLLNFAIANKKDVKFAYAKFSEKKRD